MSRPKNPTPEQIRARTDALNARADEARDAARESARNRNDVRLTTAERIEPLSKAWPTDPGKWQDEAVRAAQREQTLALVRAIEADANLLLQPVDITTPARGLLVRDIGPDREQQRLWDLASATNIERNAYIEEHGETLRKHEAQMKVDDVRRALDSDDPEVLAAALRALPTVPERDVNVLTTDDLTVTR